MNGTNIEAFVKENSKKMRESLVIAIDAFIDIEPFSDSKGTIVVYNNGIYPGRGVGQILPYIGDISLHGIVAYTQKELYNSSKGDEMMVIKMANMTANTLYEALIQIDEDKKILTNRNYSLEG